MECRYLTPEVLYAVCLEDTAGRSIAMSWPKAGCYLLVARDTEGGFDNLLQIR